MLNNIHLDEQTIQVIADTSSKTSVIAGGSVVFLGLTVDGWTIAAAAVGIITCIGTFAFNAWFKLKYQKGANDGK